MSVKVGELHGLLRMDDSQFNTSMMRAEKRTSGFGGKLASLGKFAAVGGLAIGAAFAGAVKTFIDFDDKLNQSLAIMGNVSDEMRGEMSDAAREVGRTTTFSASQAAESYFFLASAGLDAAASIEAMPVVAKFAQAGMFDMARATDLLTDAQSALGLTIRDDAVKNMENMVRVSDVLVKANTLANASVEQFSEALTNRAGAALRLLKKDIEEGVAFLAVLADQGVKGAEAGQQLNIVLRDLQRAAIGNAAAFSKAGIAVFDSSGTMRNLADITDDLSASLAGASDEQVRMNLMLLGFQDRSVSAIMQVLGLGSAMRQYEAAQRSAQGITEEVAEKQLESLKSQLILSWHGVQDLAISLSQALSPALRSAITGLRSAIAAARPAVTALGALTTVVQQQGRVITVFGAVTLGAIFIPRMAAAVASTVAMRAAIVRNILVMAQYRAAMSGTTVVQALFTSAMASTASVGLVPIAIGVGIAAAGLFVLYNRFLKGSDGADRMRERMERLDHAIQRGTRQFERQGFSLPDAELRALAREYVNVQREVQKATTIMRDGEKITLTVKDALALYTFTAKDGKHDLEALAKAQEKVTQALAEAIKGRSLQEVAQLLADLGLETADIRDIAPETAKAIDKVADSAAEAAVELTPAIERLDALFSVAEDAAGAVDGLRRSFDSLLAPETQQEAALRAQISLYDVAIAQVKADASARGDSQEAIDKQTKAYEDAKKPLEAQLDLLGATKTAHVDLAVAQSGLLPTFDQLSKRFDVYQGNLQDIDVWNRIVSDSMEILEDAATKARTEGLDELADHILQVDVPALFALQKSAGKDTPDALNQLQQDLAAAKWAGLVPLAQEIERKMNPALGQLQQDLAAAKWAGLVPVQQELERKMNPTLLDFEKALEQRASPALSGLNRLARGEVTPTMKDFANTVTQKTAPAVQSLSDKVTDLLPGLDELSRKRIEVRIRHNLDSVLDALRSVLDLAGRAARGAPGDPLGLGNLQSRAHGGPVAAGLPFLVGETGAELFTPAVAGQITPLSDNERAIRQGIAEFASMIMGGSNQQQIDQRFYGTTIVARQDVRSAAAELGLHAARMGP